MRKKTKNKNKYEYCGNMGSNSQHIPVLLNEVLEILAPQKGETVIDATFGGGGHAEAFLSKIGIEGTFLGIDKDKDVAEREKSEIEIATGSFEDIETIANNFQINQADIIFFDFGLSSDQLNDPKRGFSFSKSGSLDMRMDQRQKLTAAQILNEFSKDELKKIFQDYGEERNASLISQKIIEKRAEEPLLKTNELYQLIKDSLPAVVKHKADDVARRIFQSLRIAVNEELKIIEIGLRQAFGLLKPGGRLGAISFHSLEDRIVKSYFNLLNTDCICPPEFPICTCNQKQEAKILTKKAVIASEEEINNNPRSKSAKFRAIKKL